MLNYPYRTCVEIDLNKLERNLLRVREMAGPGVKIMEVLKADAYGHGIRMCARYAKDYVDWFAAATLEEAEVIREEAFDTPILIMGSLLDHEVTKAARLKLTIALFSEEYACRVQQILADNDLVIDGHIKIETGMNRLGLRAREGDTAEAVKAAARMFSLPNIRITGIYTHFACGDIPEPEDREFTGAQYRAFAEVLEALGQKGFDVGIRHTLSSGGLYCHSDFCMDMVRVGILPLGDNIDEQSTDALGFEPVMNWYAKIIDIRTIKEGDSVSYGRLHRARKDERIAIISVGYADGYSRAFSGRAEVIVAGKKVPQIGKTCMDFIMADITDAPGAKIGDQAVLLGEEGDLRISLHSLIDIFPYGTDGCILAAISPRVKRIYRYNGEVVGETSVHY